MDVAPQYFNGKPQNIGLHLGDKYGSADVDCDCAEAITAARDLLPETGMIFGRQSKPFSHFFYRSDPPARTEQFHDPLDHKTLIELRGLSSDGYRQMRYVYSNPVSLQFLGGVDARAATAKWVEDYIAFIRACCDDPLQESLRLLRGIAEAFLSLRVDGENICPNVCYDRPFHLFEISFKPRPFRLVVGPGTDRQARRGWQYQVRGERERNHFPRRHHANDGDRRCSIHQLV